MNAISVASGAIAKGGKRAQFIVVGGALVAAFLLYSSLTGTKTTTAKPTGAKTAAVAAATASALPAARTVTPPASYEITKRDPFAFVTGPDGSVAQISTMGGRIIAAEQLLVGAQGALTPVLSGRPTLELTDPEVAAALPGVAIVAKDAAPKTSAELSYSGTADQLVLATRAEGGDCFLLRLSKAAGQVPIGYARVTSTAGSTCRADATEAVTFAGDQVTAGWVSVG